VFPELALSAYSIEDLLLQDALLDGVERAAAGVIEASRGLLPLLVLGAPMRHAGRVYNTALVVHRGRLLGVVPKTYLPTYREFYERRQCAPGDGAPPGDARFAGQVAPFGSDLLFAAEDVPGLVVHTEICEDFWVPIPPSSAAALAGATVLLNISGSPITVGKADTRRLLCQSQSARCLAAYVYTAAGAGESTTEVPGTARPRSSRTARCWPRRSASLRTRRWRWRTWTSTCCARSACGWGPSTTTAAPRPPPELPPRRLPAGPAGRRHRLRAPRRALPLRARQPRAPRAGLLRGVQHPGRRAGAAADRRAHPPLGDRRFRRPRFDPRADRRAKAMDLLGRPRTDIVAYTMPGFATSEGTKGNAHRLMRALGVAAEELDIRPAARQMLSDLRHPFARGEPVYDVTFENVQAGLRTDYLFRAANLHDGIVLGTGDLSELALGWCTYGVGDQMSHYNVNAGVPKTLIQHLIRWVVSSRQFDDGGGGDAGSDPRHGDLARTGPGRRGRRLQSTEAKIGPYGLQDFNLFYTLRTASARPRSPSWRCTPGATRPGRLAAGLPGRAARRLRAARDPPLAGGLPAALLRLQPVQALGHAERPKVAAGGSLSPRGDWRAPSDGNANAWLEELRRNVPE
jgi:NAD+ synthase (glutamine-hydrolysing)